jgi:hypothetical protein
VSRQRRPGQPSRDSGDRDAASGEGRGEELSPELSELAALGNQALTERSGLGSDGTEVGERVGLSLRIAPRDAAWTERLLTAVERSGLSAERKEAVTARLRWDQIHADDVQAAIRAAYGTDGPELRSTLIGAVEAGAGPAEEVARRIADATPVTEDAAVGLVRALSLVRPLWDEEEEEDPPQYEEQQT